MYRSYRGNADEDDDPEDDGALLLSDERARPGGSEKELDDCALTPSG